MMNCKTGDLYRLDFADGKSYIGASISGAKQRYKDHQKDTAHGSQTPVHNAWRALGAPVLIVIKKSIPEKELWRAEKETIIKYNTKTPYGYNSHHGSDKAPGPLGKLHTEKTKKLMSQAKLGKKQSKETIEKKRQVMLRRYEDPKEREKTRLLSLGRKVTEKTREKIRHSLLGVKHTAARRKKISQAKLGKKLTPEHIKRVREGMLKYWANYRRLKGEAV